MHLCTAVGKDTCKIWGGGDAWAKLKTKLHERKQVSCFLSIYDVH